MFISIETGLHGTMKEIKIIN